MFSYHTSRLLQFSSSRTKPYVFAFHLCSDGESKTHTIAFRFTVESRYQWRVHESECCDKNRMKEKNNEMKTVVRLSHCENSFFFSIVIRSDRGCFKVVMNFTCRNKNVFYCFFSADCHRRISTSPRHLLSRFATRNGTAFQCVGAKRIVAVRLKCAN